GDIQHRVQLLSVTPQLFHMQQALALNDPQLCYILDGFLGLYGLIITGMFIKEKQFVCVCVQDLRGQDSGGYAPLMRRDPESGGRVSLTVMVSATLMTDRLINCFLSLQGLSAATKDTYQTLEMQPLPAR
uniref:Uncharacterized protein n=1 Tax=Monopterus albus TaxID=43700 RepID=A0A3Q3ICQ9_MONAL